jgi:3-deoxy-D-manno-octulosonic-acid transferase
VESFLESEQMLIDLIKTHTLEAAQAGNWSAVAATLNAQTVEVRNDKSWTMADLITLLGAESAAVIGGTIQAAGASNPIFAGAWLALNITGLQLHTDERQAMIAGLADAAGWPAELKAGALAAGLTYTSLAGEAVTAEECESTYGTDRLQSAWVTWLNETINPLIAVGDVAGVNAALAGKQF